MDTYTMAVPALDPLAYGARDDPAPAIEEGDPINVENLIAAMRQMEWRKQAAPGLVRNNELADAFRRYHIVKILHMDIDPAEAHDRPWAEEFLQRQDQRMTLLEQRQNDTLELMDGVDESIRDIRASQRAMEQRLQQALNRGLKKSDEDLEPVIRLEDGAVPQNFPATMYALNSATRQEVDRLLHFYGLPDDGTLWEKKRGLGKFFGSNI